MTFALIIYHKTTQLEMYILLTTLNIKVDKHLNVCLDEEFNRPNVIPTLNPN